ncbi:MAG: zf-HC2 domain-containing protein [Myxococcota bacterium]
MNHAVVTEHLADYLEGDLELDVRALVDAHLDACEDCAREVREMQQTIRLLRALPEPEVPPMIAANVMRRIRAGETRPGLIERIQRAVGGVLEPSFVLPAAAVAVAGLAVVLVQRSDSGRDLFAFATGAAGPEPVVVAHEAAVGEEALVMAERGIERGFGASAAREPGTRVDSASRGRDVRGVDAIAATPSSRAHDPSVPFAPMSERGERLASTVHVTRDGATVVTWEQSAWPWSHPARAGDGAGGRAGVLAQGFASEVAGPATRPSNRVPGELASATVSRRLAPGDARGFAHGDTGGEDPRDVWLARAFGHPADFARFIAQHNLAEQELWVARLSERAMARGLLGDLVEALRGAGDEKAAWLADDFAAQERTRAAGDLDDRSAGSAVIGLETRTNR